MDTTVKEIMKRMLVPFYIEFGENLLCSAQKIKCITERDADQRDWARLGAPSPPTVKRDALNWSAAPGNDG